MFDLSTGGGVWLALAIVLYQALRELGFEVRVIARALAKASVRDIYHEYTHASRDDLLHVVRRVYGHEWGLASPSWLSWLPLRLFSVPVRTLTTKDGKTVPAPMRDDNLSVLDRVNRYEYERDGFLGISVVWFGWVPVLVAADGINKIMADEQRLLHTGAYSVLTRPSIHIWAPSMIPTSTWLGILLDLRILTKERSAKDESLLARAHLRNHFALVTTDGKRAAAEVISRRPHATTFWPNPGTLALERSALKVLSTKDAQAGARFNILLHGPYGTGKTWFTFNLAHKSTAESIVQVTKRTRMCTLAETVLGSSGPLIILLDDMDAMFDDASETVMAKNAAAAPTMALHLRMGRKPGGGDDDGDDDTPYSSTLITEQDLMAILDGTLFSSFRFPMVVVACTNFIDRIPERVRRWGRFNVEHVMPVHTAVSARAHLDDCVARHNLATIIDEATLVTLAEVIAERNLTTGFVESLFKTHALHVRTGGGCKVLVDAVCNMDVGQAVEDVATACAPRVAVVASGGDDTDGY